MIPVASPWQKFLCVGPFGFRRHANGMLFLNVFDILFFRLSDVKSFVAGVDVECAAPCEGGFRHEEDDEEKHNHRSATHRVHSDAIRASLDN